MGKEKCKCIYTQGQLHVSILCIKKKCIKRNLIVQSSELCSSNQEKGQEQRKDAKVVRGEVHLALAQVSQFS